MWDNLKLSNMEQEFQYTSLFLILKREVAVKPIGAISCTLLNIWNVPLHTPSPLPEICHILN
jgi:hypothetical protein